MNMNMNRRNGKMKKLKINYLLHHQAISVRLRSMSNWQRQPMFHLDWLAFVALHYLFLQFDSKSFPFWRTAPVFAFSIFEGKKRTKNAIRFEKWKLQQEKISKIDKRSLFTCSHASKLASESLVDMIHKCPAPCGALLPFLKCGFIDRLCRTEFFQRSSFDL